jgi:hypothetical protein
MDQQIDQDDKDKTNNFSNNIRRRIDPHSCTHNEKIRRKIGAIVVFFINDFIKRENIV